MSLLLTGLAASSGVTIAPAYLLVGSDLSIPQQHIADENHEVARLHDSFALTAKELRQISKRAHQSLGQQAVAVVDMQLTILQNPTLRSTIKKIIHQDKVTAEWAVKQACDQYQDLLKHVDNKDYLNGRLLALKDVYKRLVSHLLGKKLPDPQELDHQAIIVANSVTSTDMAQFDRRYVTGLVTDEGGRTSHFSIMSKALSLPTVVGTKKATTEIKNGDLLIVDGIHGKVIVQPTADQIEHYRLLAGEFAREQQEWGSLRDKKTVSEDGRTFEVAANAGTFQDIKDIQRTGADGIGLLRSEFLYMDNKRVPTEEEQFQAYKRFVVAMNQQRVVVRTLDVGGDKQLPMVKLPAESNPALGFRAIRIGLAQPSLLRPQLRAILRASAYGRLAVMFPMVATIEEFRQARAILDDEQQQLRAAGVPVADNVEVGMMLEIPSAAVMADVFAQDVDFFSIGSNDLIQYLFAADRGNANVAYLYQELHPAVLRLVKRVIDAAHAEGKWVGMCGEMVGNPLATPLLVAMGLDEFSMNSSQILRIKSFINHLNTRQLQPLIHRALDAKSAKEVEMLVKEYVPSLHK